MVMLIVIILVIGVVVYALYSHYSKGDYRIYANYIHRKSPGWNNFLRYGKTRGTFSITGSHHLSTDVHEYVWKHLKTGDELKLIPDRHFEEGGEEIKVIFNNRHIGWLRGDSVMKDKLYDALVKGRAVKAKCISNTRGPEYKRIDGNMKYLGMKQFITGKFEYET